MHITHIRGLTAAQFLIDQQLECDVNGRLGRGEIIKHFVTGGKKKLPPHTQSSVCRNETLIHNWKHSVMKSKD